MDPAVLVAIIALAGTGVQAWRQYRASSVKQQLKTDEAAARAAPAVIETSLRGWKTLTDRLDGEIRRRVHVEAELRTRIAVLEGERDDCERRVRTQTARVTRLEQRVTELGGALP